MQSRFIKFGVQNNPFQVVVIVGYIFKLQLIKIKLECKKLNDIINETETFSNLWLFIYLYGTALKLRF